MFYNAIRQTHILSLVNFTFCVTNPGLFETILDECTLFDRVCFENSVKYMTAVLKLSKITDAGFFREFYYRAEI